MSDKKAAGQARKAEAAAAAKANEEAARQAEEDASWADGAKKGNKKKEDEEAKKAAKALRKAEADEQAEAEEAEFGAKKVTGTKAKKAAGAGPKLTRAEIAAKALAKAEAEAKAKKKEKMEIDMSGGNDYMGALRENDNKSSEVDASGIDSAIAALAVDTEVAGKGRVNMKAAYKAFEEAEMARLKDDQPGLKLSQYKERCWQAWQKSPENPMNAAA